MHNEYAEFAVRDVENELHFLVRAVYRDFVRCRGSTALNDGIEVAEQLDDFLAKHVAKVCTFYINGFATEASEIEIDVLTLDVNR